jgi:hypothetical protein
MDKLELTQLESEVLNILLEGDDPILKHLRKQATVATISARENTGYGFYLDFEVSADKITPIHTDFHTKPNFCFGDVAAAIEPLQNGAGFLLWIKDGYLAMLEGYTYDEKWPSKIAKYKLRYSNGKRDWTDLQRQWKVQV